MNEKITLPTLVSLLADKTGKQKKQCEDFLREFFNTLVDAMEAGENVRIKSLGTFKVVAVEPRKSVNVNTGEQMEIPGHNKIVFVPAKELAEEVNAPFAMFESIEIPDNALEDPLLSLNLYLRRKPKKTLSPPPQSQTRLCLRRKPQGTQNPMRIRMKTNRNSSLKMNPDLIHFQSCLN